MNKAQTEFLLANKFEQDKFLENVFYKNNGIFNFWIRYKDNEIKYGVYVDNVYYQPLEYVKTYRKEIEQFEKVCIKLEELGNETEIK